MGIPLPELTRCKVCGTIPVLSTGVESAIIFCSNLQCPASGDVTIFRRATLAKAVAEAIEEWQKNNENTKNE